jgi:hypothetical protein
MYERLKAVKLEYSGFSVEMLVAVITALNPDVMNARLILLRNAWSS